ncbi:hypothetical protein SK74_04298, partial [Escherichia coli]
MARSDYDIINLSLEHELNEWLAERGYAGLAYNRNRVVEVVTRKLQDSFYINVSWDALNTAYNEHPELMNPLMILVKIIKLRWIHILSYDQMVSRKIN